MEGEVQCKNPACQSLSDGFCTARQILEEECATCRSERNSRALVLEGGDDARLHVAPSTTLFAFLQRTQPNITRTNQQDNQDPPPLAPAPADGGDLPAVEDEAHYGQPLGMEPLVADFDDVWNGEDAEEEEPEEDLPYSERDPRVDAALEAEKQALLLLAEAGDGEDLRRKQLSMRQQEMRKRDEEKDLKKEAKNAENNSKIPRKPGRPKKLPDKQPGDSEGSNKQKDNNSEKEEEGGGRGSSEGLEEAK